MAASHRDITPSSVASADTDLTRLVVISYNLHGINQGRTGITELISKIEPDAIMVQEHWLTPDNLYKLNELSSNYFVFGSSAMNACITKGPLVGRPFGGTAILINKKHASATTTIVSCDRFTAVKISKWLLITVYMPCVGTNQRDILYSAVLTELDALICAQSSCHCLIGGDFNTCLDNNTNVSITVNDFIRRNLLYRCDVLFPVADKFTFYNETKSCGSTIDYMLTSNQHEMVAYNILDMDLNLSDHIPIMSICACNDEAALQIEQRSRAVKVEHLRWDHAPIDKYYEHTRLLLQPVYDDLNSFIDRFDDLDEQTVVDNIESIYANVVAALRSSANNFIPKHRKNFFKFWWSQELDALKDKAIVSCREWKNAGKPRNGVIFEQYRKDKLLYKKRIHEEQAAETNVFTNDLHDALIQKSGQDFGKSGDQNSPANLQQLYKWTASLMVLQSLKSLLGILSLLASHSATVVTRNSVLSTESFELSTLGHR